MEFHARSITIFATAANCSFFLTYARISRSLCRKSGNSWGEAYQRERQSRFTPSLNPIGLTFCPIKLFLRRRFFLLRLRLLFGRRGFVVGLPRRLLFLLRLFVRQNDSNVRGPLQDPRSASPRASRHSFESRTLPHGGLLHDQAIHL